MLLYLVFRAASLLVPRLPVSLGYWLCNQAAWLAYLCNASARRHGHANLRRVLGPGASGAQRRTVLLQAFRTAARNYYDLFRLPRLRLANLQDRVVTVGWEHIDQALAQGKGAIVVSPHMGCFELMTQLATNRNLSVTVPIERVRPARLFNMMMRLRSCQGLRVVPADGGAMRAIVRALRRNEIVAMAGDRDVLGNGMTVSFFGQPARVPQAPALISLRTGAPILPAYSIRQRDGTYLVHVEPPLAADGVEKPQDRARALTMAMVSALERFVSLHPDQWMVFEPVWEG